jgi:dihydroxyacetone kinase-like predicted kinase
MCLIQDGDLEEVVKDMNTALSEVVTGEITTATRDVEIDGVGVKEGHIIALLDGKLVLSAENLEEVTLGLFEKVEMDDYELITLFYGEDMKEEEVHKISKKISKTYPDHDIEIQEGGQPHYQFIISIE